MQRAASALGHAVSRPAGLGSASASAARRSRRQIAAFGFLRGQQSRSTQNQNPSHGVWRAQAGGPRSKVADQAQDESVESPFFEPFVRSLLLGVGSAVLLETAHVALEAFGLAESMGMTEVARALLTAEDSFAPLFVADHVAAIAGWVGFYAIEAAAIAAVLRSYAGDAAAASPAIQNMVTLPKQLLPVRLQLFKRFFLQPSTPALAGASAGAAAPIPAAGSPTSTAAAAPSTTTAGTPGPALPVASAFVEDGSAGQLGGSDGAMERQQYPSSLPRHSGTGAAAAAALRKTRQEAKPLRPASPPREGEKANILPAGQGLAERRARQGLKPGEWDASASSYARRQKELLGRRSYLRNFWYAAALSENVKEGKPHGVTMMGRQFVLFRGEDGVVRCLDDVCPHRGAPLSEGWLTKVDGHDCVVCPYHGWAFDDTGSLRDVPAAESTGEWPKRPIVPTFPVEEKGGFIWLFYGSKDLPPEERPPIPYVPELDDPEWKPVYGEIEFDCNHFGVFENAVDMAHIHYLHSDSFGNQGQPQIRDMQTETDAFSVSATFKLHNKPVSALWEWSKVPVVEVTARAYLPSTSAISFTLGNGLSFTTFVNTVPVSANKTVNRFSLVRNLSWDNTGVFNAGAWDQWARRAMLRILGEDKVMVERLRYDLLPTEYSVRADLPQIAFRKLRQQYVDMGFAEPNELDAGHMRSSDI